MKNNIIMKTELVKVSDNTDNSAVEKAVKLLSDGKVIAFPTETVYGVGARADISEGWELLTKIKQRPANKPFTLHLGHKGDISCYVPFLQKNYKRLINKLLPGPLTIVFELSEAQLSEIRSRFSSEVFSNLYFDNSIGVRVPDNEIAAALLSTAGGPVVASSANPAGEPPACNAESVQQYLDGQISLTIDNGPTKIQKASTVIKISDSNLEMLREGIFDKELIYKALNMNILFVCTGNTCRSPMAYGFGRSTLAKKLDCSIDQLEEKGYYIESAGVMAMDGSFASDNAIAACKEYGVDINQHRSKLITEDMVRNADHILVMSEGHRRSLLDIAPYAAEKTSLLSPSGVSDPFGMDQKTYNKCAKQIKDAVEHFINELGIE